MAAETAEPIVREIDIDAPPETVFAFFVDAGKLTRWLAIEATLDPRPGGACVQVHQGDRRGGPVRMHGQFLEVDPPTRVVFSWGFTDPRIGVPPGSTTVEVTLQPAGSGTRVRLVHRDLPAAEVQNHARGWTEMLQRLARAVATSPDATREAP
jgi:uncharacterized protein YndB with AHSA1/START domain